MTKKTEAKAHPRQAKLQTCQKWLPNYRDAGMFVLSWVHSGMNRIRLTPRWMENMFGYTFKVYLHNFIGPDEGDELHNHPWHSLSIKINGTLQEKYLAFSETDTDRGDTVYARMKFKFAPFMQYRSPEYSHKIVDGSWKTNNPPWTLFIIWGKNGRDWGFWNHIRGGLHEHSDIIELKFEHYKSYLGENK